MERYSSKVACAVGRLTYRQLDYMIRDGFFTPDVPAAGTGNARGFSFRDLLALRCIGNLRAADVSLQAVRKVDRALRAYGRDMAGAHLVVTGRGRDREVYVSDRDQLIALLTNPGQLGWATIVDVGQAAAEVREIVEQNKHAAEEKPKRKRAAGGRR
jgi:DNA-binding transcriptional MerR regulator